MNDKIKLNNIKVIFANIKDEGFGRSITIDATDKEVQEQIAEWVKENKIGKSTPGEAKFKEYQPEEGDKVIQYSFKINDYTKFIGLNGLTIDDLGYGAEISLVAQSFHYSNKFGTGTSASLTAVLITKAVRTSADDDIDDLLTSAGVDPSEAKEQPKEQSGYEAAKATAEALKPAAKQAEDAREPEPIPATITDEGEIESEIDLSSIPF